jgi:hypothetical protein
VNEPVSEPRSPDVVVRPSSAEPTGAQLLAERRGTFDTVVEHGFVDVGHHHLRWTGRHTSAEMRDLFGTFSNVLALDEERRLALLDRIAAIVDEQFGGVVERPYVTALYLGRKP